MMKEINESIKNYNDNGCGVTTASIEEINGMMRITITEPWKAMLGFVVATFKANEISKAQEYIETKENENAEYVARLKYMVR